MGDGLCDGHADDVRAGDDSTNDSDSDPVCDDQDRSFGVDDTIVPELVLALDGDGDGVADA